MGKRYVAMGRETGNYGEAVAAVRYAEAIASIKPDQKWIIPTPIASRAYRKRNLGPYRARGSIGDFPLEPEGIIGDLLYGVFGSVNSVLQSGNVYAHTFIPADTLPSYTVRLGVELTERVLPGSLVESLIIKYAHDNDIMANAEILSGFPETKATIATPTISPLQALNMQAINSSVTIGGNEERNIVYDIEMSIKNNIPFEKGSLAGRTFNIKRVTNREATGKLSAYFDNTNDYDRFIGGSEFTVDVICYGPIIEGILTYILEVTMHKCIFTGGVPDVKAQNELLVVDAPFKAFYDAGWAGGGAEVKAILENAISAY